MEEKYRDMSMCLQLMCQFPNLRLIWNCESDETGLRIGSVKHSRMTGAHRPNEFLYFLSIANGSLAELDTQRIIAEKLGFLSSDSSSDLDIQIAELRKMLYSLIRSL